MTPRMGTDIDPDKLTYRVDSSAQAVEAVTRGRGEDKAVEEDDE